MASRRLCNRSLSVVSQAGSDHSENMDSSDVTCFESNVEVTVRENPALERAEQNENIAFTSNDNVTIFTDSKLGKDNMSATQLKELLANLMQNIQSEICKQTAVLEEKFTAESNNQSAESAKQTAALAATMDSRLASAIEKLKSELRYENEKLTESLIARSESANAAIREELNTKLSSEIRVVTDKIDDVSRDTKDKITTLSNTIDSVRECIKERMNAHVVQARKETDRQGQEITAASSSLLASIKEHKEKVGVTIDNLRQQISKSKEYVVRKCSTISGEIQDFKQHSSAQISRLSATVGDLQAKLVTGTSDSVSPAVPVRVDVRSEVVQQVDSAIDRPGSSNALPSLPGANGVNGSSTSVCNYVNSVMNQPINSCSCGNVNATSKLHAKSAELCELTLPNFSDSTKQVPLYFIRDLDLISSSDRHLKNYAYLWYSGLSKNLSQSSGFPVLLTNLKVTTSLRKSLRNYFGMQVVRPVLGVRYI